MAWEDWTFVSEEERKRRERRNGYLLNLLSLPSWWRWTCYLALAIDR